MTSMAARPAFSRQLRCAFQAVRRLSLNSAATALFTSSSRKLAPTVLRGLAPAPALLRGGPTCSAASADEAVELQLKIDGMVCDGCSSRVLEALQKLPGVKSVEVDLEKGVATLTVEAASQVDAFNTLPKLIEVVTELGFEAQPHFE